MSAATSPHPFDKPTVNPSDHQLRPVYEQDAAAWYIAARVPDPEIPVISIADLGILHDAELVGDEAIVTNKHSYSVRPAMDHITADVTDDLKAAGFDQVTVDLVLQPAWTTDWMTEEGRENLREYGIAPPTGKAAKSGPI